MIIFPVIIPMPWLRQISALKQSLIGLAVSLWSYNLTSPSAQKKDTKRIDDIMCGCCSMILLFSPHIFVRSAFLGSLWRIWNINISRPSPLSSSAASSASASTSTWWWSLERSRAIADQNSLAGLLPKGAVELASPPIEAIIGDRTPMKQPYY